MAISAQADARRAKKPRARIADTSFLQNYLNSLELGVNPVIHVNGHSFPMALVTVDFGSPLKHVKLSPDQAGELTDRLKRLAREVLGREANVRVSHDGPNGVYWASVA